ncbi:MAG: 23S rRNA (uracil(1939)-C(5))-methyltransferase RlmD [Anaerolineae bacterium]|jgi:23S rRNA (uracil1939-C5)-methyltransferase
MNQSTFSLTPTAMAHGGAALGRHEGRVVFVPGAIPGETVRVEIVEDKKRFARAQVIDIIQASPDRVTPRCAHVPQCGGCQWQHIAYPRQLALKTEVVRDQLTRVGGVVDPPVRPTRPAPSPWGYRNRITFHADDERLGFQRAASHDIIAIDACHIADLRLMALYDDLDLDLPDLTRLTLMAGHDEDDLLMAFETRRDKLPELHVDFPISCVHLVNGDEAIPVNLIGNNHVTQRVGEHSYRVSAGRFFQVNTAVAALLVELVLDWLASVPDGVILDAYCGVGLFTLPLARQSDLVIAVELDPGATEDLILNLDQVENVEVIEGPVEAVLPDLVQEEALHGVVVDPPRQGLDVAVIDALVANGPSRLVYVSCDPATLARDVKRLARGDYTLTDVQPLDMFPQTYHVETVALLIR